MRHQKHSNQLGVKKEHREALMANLASALIREGRIQTTLKKAKALRPFAERLVTLAKKGGIANRRLAMARVRDTDAVQTLFNDRVGEFVNRNGGYTRIYKLGPQRRGDAAEMAIIEWVSAEDQGYRAGKRKPKAKKADESGAKAEDESGAKAAAAEGEEAAKEQAPAEEAKKKDEAQAEAPVEEKASSAEESSSAEDKESDKK